MLLTPPRECGGCAAKADPSLVAHVVRHARVGQRPANELIGLREADDAAVQRICDDVALVTTVDGFPPPFEDPSDYGAVAAANAVADVYAMGAQVQTALCFLAFPRDTDPAYLGAIMRSAAQVVADCGGAVVGGHTVHSAAGVFSLSVTGLVHPDRVWAATGAQPGDALVLSKPLGTGLAVSAHQSGSFESAIAIMRETVQAAATDLHAMRRAPSAVTDVSGYGLLGHLKEMTRAGGIAMRIDASRVPVAPGARLLAGTGVRTRAHETNLEYVRKSLTGQPSDDDLAILLDPQTSGGLLAAVAPDEIPDSFVRIGTVVAATDNESTLVVST